MAEPNLSFGVANFIESARKLLALDGNESKVRSKAEARVSFRFLRRHALWTGSFIGTYLTISKSGSLPLGANKAIAWTDQAHYLWLFSTMLLCLSVPVYSPNSVIALF